MIRVLHLDSESGWRGGQRQLALLARGLNPSEVQSYIAAPDGSKIIETLKGEFECYPLPLKGLSQIKGAIRLKKLCTKLHIDIVDCHSSGAHSVAWIAKNMGLQSKVIVHRRVDYPPSKGFSSKKYHSPHIHAFVAISDYISKVLSDYGISDNKLRVVRSAVTKVSFSNEERMEARESLRKKLNLPPDCPLILNVAALTPQKNHELLLKAVSQISHEQQYRLIICGDGELRQSICKTIEDLNLSKKVLLMGHVKELRDYFLAADVFALSSQDEGLGTSLLDAALYELPIVSTDVGGIPEIVQNEQTGLTSSVASDKGFSLNLQRMLKDKNTCEKLSKNAKAYAEKEFTVENMVAGNLEVYKSLS